jgi:hypothetical protein
MRHIFVCAWADGRNGQKRSVKKWLKIRSFINYLQNSAGTVAGFKFFRCFFNFHALLAG